MKNNYQNLLVYQSPYSFHQFLYLNNESFIDIWRNQKFNFARKSLFEKNRNFAPCDKCDVEGTFMGHNHAKAWNEIKN